MDNQFNVSIRYYATSHRTKTVLCKVNGCFKCAKSKGYCELHYGRFKKHGDPLYLKFNREISTVKVLSQLELGYVIGLIEGEGTISLSYHGHSNDYRKRRRWDVYVKISNTDKRILENVKSIVGAGNIRLHDRKIKRPKSKPEYCWSINQHSDIEKLLEQIGPFLIIKKEQANLALEYVKIREKVRSEHRGFKSGFHDNREFRIFERFNELNIRGSQIAKNKVF
jgi:hypothetical protein